MRKKRDMHGRPHFSRPQQRCHDHKPATTRSWKHRERQEPQNDRDECISDRCIGQRRGTVLAEADLTLVNMTTLFLFLAPNNRLHSRP